MGTEAKASLISPEVDVGDGAAGPVEGLRMAGAGARPVSAGSTPTDAHERTTASDSSPSAAARSRSTTSTAGGVVHAGGVARGDGEALDLGVERL